MAHRRRLVEHVKAAIDAWRSCPRRIPGGALSAERAPAPPPPTTGLGRPETTRKEARWERAITWLLSRGKGR